VWAGGVSARRRPSLVLSVPTRKDLLPVVGLVAGRMAEAAGFDEPTAEEIGVAAGDAAANAAEHAYEGSPDERVEVRIEDRGASLQIDVIDTGRGVDPRVDLDRRGERRKAIPGVRRMEKVMDSVTFQRSGRRNVCRLVKRRPGPADADVPSET